MKRLLRNQPKKKSRTKVPEPDDEKKLRSQPVEEKESEEEKHDEEAEKSLSKEEVTEIAKFVQTL